MNLLPSSIYPGPEKKNFHWTSNASCNKLDKPIVCILQNVKTHELDLQDCTGCHIV